MRFCVAKFGSNEFVGFGNWMGKVVERICSSFMGGGGRE